MKKYLKHLALIISIIACGFLLNGCTILDWFTTSKQVLTSPVLTSNDNVIMWDGVENASGYSVYLSDQEIANIQINDTNKYTLNVSSYISSDGFYSFRVKAIGAGKYMNSDYSEAVIYTIGEDCKSVNASAISSINYYATTYPMNVTVSNDYISWEQMSGAGGYIVIVKRGNSEYYFRTKTNCFKIADMYDSTTKAISCVRVGVYYGEDSMYNVQLNAESVYYNPQNISKYTSLIYTFDGEINDYYVESQAELNNLVYYSYIMRLEDFDFQLSSDFYNTIQNTALYNSYGIRYTDIQKVNYYIVMANDSFLETSYMSLNKYFNKYSPVDNYADFIDKSSLVLNYSVNYYGATEPTGEISPTAVCTQHDGEPYYEVFNGANRSANYNNFVSDQHTNTVSVSTSEALYWAVECGVTPIPVPSSSADTIYKKAKSVLNTIIKEGMTDYDKALAIYDYIAYTTSYDHSKYSDVVYTKLPCFYLEGVFIYHVSVCDGFSKAFSLMCNMEGVDAIRIVGGANGKPAKDNLHAWNKVKIDGNWYLVDITWTEIDSGSEGHGGEEYLAHKYFCVSDNYTATTHYPCESRTKYQNYPAKYVKSYYANTFFTIDDIKYDFVITKGEAGSEYSELKALLNYLYASDRKCVEVVFDSSYISYIYSQYITQGSEYMALREAIRVNKMPTQYLSLVPNGSTYSLNKTTIYNQSNTQNTLGVVVLIYAQDQVVDADNEWQSLVANARHYDKNTIDFVVSDAYMTNFTSIDELVQTALTESDYTIEMLNKGEKAECGYDSNGNQEYGYKYRLTFTK